MRLLGDQNRQTIVRTDMPNGAIGSFELTRAPTFGQAPSNIVHDETLPTGALFPVFQFRPMVHGLPGRPVF
eukprot:COSAG02_NODE_2855_length_7889_cov_3.123363_10_plen_71_part_00